MKCGRSRGFTLLELMAVFALLSVVLAVGVILASRALATGVGYNQKAATDQARAWAEAMGFEGAKVDCAAATTVKNAMVPCSVAVPIGGGLPAIYGVECGPAVSVRGQEGCRITSAPAIVQPPPQGVER